MFNIGWRELLKVFMSFIIAMVVVNGLMVLLLYLFSSPDSALVESLYKSYMFTIGYAESSGFPLGLMMVQAMIGVILTASFAALLTYRIFRRDDDITLLRKCFIMQVEDSYALSFILHNKGKAIYDVNCEIRAYSESNSDDQEGDTIKRYRPVILKEKDWRITIQFDRNHQIYRYLENSLLTEELHIDVLVKSVDSGIGLQSMFHHEFIASDIMYVEPEAFKEMVPKDYLNNLAIRVPRNILLSKPGKGQSLWAKNSFIRTMDKPMVKEVFEDYLKFKKYEFDLATITGIAHEDQGQITLDYHPEGRRLMGLILPMDPENETQPEEPPQWMGVSLPLKGENWHYYVENHYKFYGEIRSKTIQEVTVEILPLEGHGLRHTYPMDKGVAYVVMPLDEAKSLEDFEAMNEMLITFQPDKEALDKSYDIQVKQVYLSKFHY